METEIIAAKVLGKVGRPRTYQHRQGNTPINAANFTPTIPVLHRKPCAATKPMDPRIKAKVWADYLTGQYTNVEIAKRNQISSYTMTTWIGQEKWVMRRRALEKELIDLVNFQATGMVRQHFVRIVKKHLNLTDILDVQIEKALAGELGPRNLESLAKALKSSADISARAVGLDKPNSPASQVMAGNRIINYNLSVRPLSPMELTAPPDTDFTEASFSPEATQVPSLPPERLLEAASPLSEPVIEQPEPAQEPVQKSEPAAIGLAMDFISK